jgi:predicted kinase
VARVISTALLRLVILVGLPGAGKSTLARALHDRFGWPIVDRDAIRAAMFAGVDCGDEEKAAAEEALWLAAETHLAARRSCIVDGMTFARGLQRERARELADLAGAGFAALALECPQSLAAQRVRGDHAHSAQDRDATLVRTVAARFEPLEGDCVRLDATAPADAVLRQAVEALGEA